MTLDAGVKMAMEASNFDVIQELAEERLLARPLEVRGMVRTDDYGR